MLYLFFLLYELVTFWYFGPGQPPPGKPGEKAHLEKPGLGFRGTNLNAYKSLTDKRMNQPGGVGMTEKNKESLPGRKVATSIQHLPIITCQNAGFSLQKHEFLKEAGTLEFYENISNI